VENILDILGFKVSTNSVEDIVKTSLDTEQVLVLNTINPHSYVEQKRDLEFRKALINSDILIPDGSGIVGAAKFLKNINISKIAGYDLFKETLTQLNGKSGTVFFLGSSVSVLEKMEKRAKKEYPRLNIFVLSPPFKPNFNEDEIESFSNRINDFSPDVVFVGLTAPKQEKLIAKLKCKVDVSFLSGVGAVFDFYAGTVKRPSTIWVTLHLEWLIRLLGEPKRLWKRNFVSTPIFILDLLKSKLFEERKKEK
jgi:N-acetylglucosaminyldiphosphoundecaprenol N-acetyl-beta-D-mannosaminyltransferase